MYLGHIIYASSCWNIVEWFIQPSKCCIKQSLNISNFAQLQSGCLYFPVLFCPFCALLFGTCRWTICYKLFETYVSLKVHMKWNFRLLFYSIMLKSMILWLVIFEFRLRTSTYEFILELQSWLIRVKMCDIPRAAKIFDVIRCVKPSSHHSIWGE